MKTIYFIRHAKSSWNDFSLSDYERPLDQRGLHDAPIMAKKLKQLGCKINMIISSSAVRARETAAYFGDQFNLVVHETKDLYHAEPEAYLETIWEQSEDVRHIALFGHNPGLTYLANMIKPGCIDNIPTCGIIIAEVSDNMLWANIQWKNIKLDNILTPKNL